MFRSIAATVLKALKGAPEEEREAPSRPSPGALNPAWMANVPLTPTNDFRRLTDEGYRRNVVVYICINEIAQSLAELLPIFLNPDGTEFEDPQGTDPLVSLVNQPNPEETWQTFIEGYLMNLSVAGNAYVHKARNGAGMPVEMWNLRPDRIKVIPGPQRVLGYEYRLDGVPMQPIPAQDVIHTRLRDPLDDFYGLSPVAVAGRSVDLDNKALDYMRAFFLNGGAPAGILTMKNQTEANERERIRKLWKKTYGGQRGWHDVAVIDADMAYQELGSRPEKLGMDAVWTSTESRICAAFGVPTVLVQVALGIKEGASYSSYAEAVKAFWTETLLPIKGRVEGAFNLGLCSEFSGKRKLKLDTSGVAGLQESKEKIRADLKLGWDAGFVKLDEVRKAHDLDAIGGEVGDAFKSVVNAPPSLGGFGVEAPPSPFGGGKPGEEPAPGKPGKPGKPGEEEPGKPSVGRPPSLRNAAPAVEEEAGNLRPFSRASRFPAR